MCKPTRILDRDVALQRIRVDPSNPFNEVSLLAQIRRKKMGNRDERSGGALDGVNDESSAFPVSNRVSHRRRPDVIVSGVRSAIRIDVADLSVREQQQGFLRRNEGLEYAVRR